MKLFFARFNIRLSTTRFRTLNLVNESKKSNSQNRYGQDKIGFRRNRLIVFIKCQNIIGEEVENDHKARLTSCVMGALSLNGMRLQYYSTLLYKRRLRQLGKLSLQSRRFKEQMDKPSSMTILIPPASLERVILAFSARTLLLKFLALALSRNDPFDQSKYAQILKRLDASARKAEKTFREELVADELRSFHFNFDPLRWAEKTVKFDEKLDSQRYWWIMDEGK